MVGTVCAFADPGLDVCHMGLTLVTIDRWLGWISTRFRILDCLLDRRSVWLVQQTHRLGSGCKKGDRTEPLAPMTRFRIRIPNSGGAFTETISTIPLVLNTAAVVVTELNSGFGVASPNAQGSKTAMA